MGHIANEYMGAHKFRALLGIVAGDEDLVRLLPLIKTPNPQPLKPKLPTEPETRNPKLQAVSTEALSRKFGSASGGLTSNPRV